MKKDARGTKSKYWCFTINNPTKREATSLSNMVADGIAGYVVYGREEGENGTPHLQGYVEFTNRKRITTIKKLTGFSRAHLEIRRGTNKEAREYCRKDGDVEEYGEFKERKQGQRSDLEDIKEEIADGASELEIADKYFSRWCVFRRSFHAYKGLLSPPKRRNDLSVLFLHGAPGTGKTRFAHESEDSLFTVPTHDLKWFDGYNQEEAVLIDDFRGGCEFGWLLRVLDIYPLQVPVKGSFAAWNPVRIYITSNLPMSEWGYEENLSPLERRIHGIVQVEQWFKEWPQQKLRIAERLEQSKGGIRRGEGTGGEGDDSSKLDLLTPSPPSDDTRLTIQQIESLIKNRSK